MKKANERQQHKPLKTSMAVERESKKKNLNLPPPVTLWLQSLLKFHFINARLHKLSAFFFLTFFFITLQLSTFSCFAQGVGINSTGVSPAVTNMLEVLDTKTTDNSTGFYVSQSGAVGAGTGYALQAIKSGASLSNIAAYLSASGATNNYALIVPSGGGNVGIGTTSPGELLSIGSNTFQVNSSGNLVKINNVTYSWPAAQGGANQVLTNDGSGTLSWAAPGGGSGTYADIDAETVPAVGEVASEGYTPGVALFNFVSDNRPYQFIGAFANKGSRKVLCFFSETRAGTATSSDILTPLSNSPGTRLRIKGILDVGSLTELNASYYPIVLGLAMGITGVGAAQIGAGAALDTYGHQTETTRDDQSQVAIVIDNLGNIHYYNCTSAGDATLTDSGFDAATSGGIPFEYILEIPSAATTFNNLKVTIKIKDSAGTWRTILNEVNPVANAALANLQAALQLNCDVALERCAFENSPAN